MTFLWPGMLWLLILIPLLIAFYFFLLRRKKKTALRYASLSVVKEAMGTGPGLRRHLPPLLFLLAVTVLLMAMARPAALVTLPSQHGTVILAMDISGSMRATDIEPSRLEAAQEAARTFISDQPRSVRIGIVSFAGTAAVVQAPTNEREHLLDAIDRFYLQRATAIGSGIYMALSAIFEDEEEAFIPPDPLRGGRGAPLGQERVPGPDRQQREPVEPGSYRSAVIVLLTDGQTTTGPDPLEAAAAAAERGVRVFTVGLGTDEGEIIGFYGRSMRVRLDEPTLEAIAETTGGEYFRAGTEGALQDVYRALSTKFSLEKDEVEITAAFSAAAAVLLLAAAVLSMLWFGRIA